MTTGVAITRTCQQPRCSTETELHCWATQQTGWSVGYRKLMQRRIFIVALTCRVQTTSFQKHFPCQNFLSIPLHWIYLLVWFFWFYFLFQGDITNAARFVMSTLSAHKKWTQRSPPSLWRSDYYLIHPSLCYTYTDCLNSTGHRIQPGVLSSQGYLSISPAGSVGH